MLDLGMVKPGSTIYIPFHTFDSNDPSASVIVSAFVAGDIEVYKNGSVTQRASDSGYTLLDTDGINFDGTTGIHGFSIDLADNTTAEFWQSGEKYFVVVGPVTIDAATVNFLAATFEIGYPSAFLNTSIATLASQTSFTLDDAPADDDALNGCLCIVHDVASAVQIAVGFVLDYTGSSKTVTLQADPAIFTMAATDNISFFLPANVGAWNNVALPTTNPLPNAASDTAGGIPISDAGGLDMDAKLANTNEVTAARMGALTDWINGGRLDLLLDAIPTTAMRGTDNAALASVLGALADAASADDPTTADTLMQYVKQLINILIGAAGIANLRAAAAPANAVSLSEMIRAIYDDSNELQGDWVNAGRLDAILDARASQTTVDNIETDTQNIQTRLPTALVSSRMDSTVDATGMESGAVDNILTTQMTESYAANGVAPTLAQAMFAVHQMLMQFGIASTSYTVRKLDDSTTAFVVTLDDATTPTDAKRV